MENELLSEQHPPIILSATSQAWLWYMVVLTFMVNRGLILPWWFSDFTSGRCHHWWLTVIDCWAEWLRNIVILKAPHQCVPSEWLGFVTREQNLKEYVVVAGQCTSSPCPILLNLPCLALNWRKLCFISMVCLWRVSLQLWQWYLHPLKLNFLSITSRLTMSAGKQCKSWSFSVEGDSQRLPSATVTNSVDYISKSSSIRMFHCRHMLYDSWLDMAQL